MHFCFYCLKYCLKNAIKVLWYQNCSYYTSLLSNVMKSSLCSFSLANTASDKKLLIVVDTNILMNHLKFVRILKTTEISGIYRTYLPILIFLFELVLYMNSDVGSPPPQTYFHLDMLLSMCVYIYMKHNQLKLKKKKAFTR